MSSDYIDIVFDGPPSHKGARLVEVNNSKGESIRAGDWIVRDDGLWALRIGNARVTGSITADKMLNPGFRETVTCCYQFGISCPVIGLDLGGAIANAESTLSAALASVAISSRNDQDAERVCEECAKVVKDACVQLPDLREEVASGANVAAEIVEDDDPRAEDFKYGALFGNDTLWFRTPEEARAALRAQAAPATVAEDAALGDAEKEDFIQAAIRVMQKHPGFAARDYADGITADDFETFFAEDMNEAWRQVERLTAELARLRAPQTDYAGVAEALVSNDKMLGEMALILTLKQHLVGYDTLQALARCVLSHAALAKTTASDKESNGR